VTPTQLRAFAAVARRGSVKEASVDLGVSDAAISLHVAQLRKELGDQLFVRTSSGLAFTPGGLRLASRASEMLGLQDRTIQEVSQAGGGRRLLRVAASSLFAEHAAPGLIELFTSRADDLDVELSVASPARFDGLLLTRSVDVALGPVGPDVAGSLVRTPFLKYQVVTVVGATHPLATGRLSLDQLRHQTWLLGPAAAAEVGVVPQLLRRLRVPEERMRIFQSGAAALEETQRGNGVSLAPSFVVAQDLAAGRLVKLAGPTLTADGIWSALTMPDQMSGTAVAELTRFVSTPRATQAMLRGSGVNVGHFKPSVHVTLWS
jgi:LysR family transcriptional regulator, low CO2-responsive transcriptional regulator